MLPLARMQTLLIYDYRPSNPHYMQIWRFLKKVQENLEIGTSNLEISKICVKLKKINRLFVWVVFYLFSTPPPPHTPVVFFLLFRGKSLRFRRRIKVILRICFALYTTKSWGGLAQLKSRSNLHTKISKPLLILFFSLGNRNLSWMIKRRFVAGAQCCIGIPTVLCKFMMDTGTILLLRRYCLSFFKEYFSLTY